MGDSNMKLYNKIIMDNLSYEKVVVESKILEGNGNVFITRPEWDGVHFMVKDDYFILTKDKQMIVNPKNVYSLDKNDWMIVTIDDSIKDLINNSVSVYYDNKKKRLFKKKRGGKV